MENSEKEVYLASKCYCRVGKITPKKIDEDKTTAKADS
jgi:hypothetical protein